MDDNEWLTLEEREAMKEEERVAAGEAHVKAVDRKITFDFAGRNVVALTGLL